MKNFNVITPRIFQLLLVSILATFSFKSMHAQCISGLNYTYALTSTSAIPVQCTYTVNVCVTVHDITTQHLSYSISNGAHTFNSTEFGPFTANQVVCSDLDIIIPLCDVTERVNIDVGSKDTGCVDEVYDGPLDPIASLAVEFAYLNGYQSKNDIILEWITETESSNDYFEIEHSNDGRNFEYVEKIDGAGNSVEANVYNFTHHFPTAGKNYYRIKMVDFAGLITYSDVITVTLESKGIVTIFPTAVDSELNVKIFNVIRHNIPITIFDAAGNEIGSYLIPSGGNSLQIPTSNLIAGIYYLKIKLKGEGVITKPFIKKTL